MKRSYDQLLSAIKTTGEPDMCPVNAQRMIKIAKLEVQLNEQGFTPEQIATLNAEIDLSVSAASAVFTKKCA